MHFLGLMAEVEGIRLCCCRLLAYEVHYYSLSLSSLDCCMFCYVCINNK